MGSRFTQLKDGSFVDRKSGEVFEEEQFTFIIFPKRAKLKGKRWFMMFQDAFEMLAKDRDLRGEPRAILDFLMSKLGFENQIALSQTEVAEALGINKVNVSQGIKKLLNKEVLLKDAKQGRSQCYKLNPEYGWKGRVENLNEEVRNQHLKKALEKLDAKENVVDIKEQRKK
jgi:DNA-binding MarR family transcriptional regulator